MKANNVEIKCDGETTEVFINGEKQKNIISCVFRHYEDDRPELEITYGVEPSRPRVDCINKSE